MRKLILMAIASVLMIGTAQASSISTETLRAGVSSSKTSLAQKDWWNAHMSGKVHRFTGIVQNVTEGTFSGYWVNLWVDHSFSVDCGLSSDSSHVARSLSKGDTFICEGEVSSTWTKGLFGTTPSFSMDGMTREEVAAKNAAQQSTQQAAEKAAEQAAAAALVARSAEVSKALKVYGKVATEQLAIMCKKYNNANACVALEARDAALVAEAKNNVEQAERAEVAERVKQDLSIYNDMSTEQLTTICKQYGTPNVCLALEARTDK